MFPIQRPRHDTVLAAAWERIIADFRDFRFTWRGFWRWTGITLAAILVAALVTLYFLDWNQLRGPIGRWASHHFAIAYIQGEGVGRDDAAAAAWFARAATGGYVDSAFDLAVLYEKGQGVRQDAHQALRWYHAAAAAGDAQAASRAKLLAEQAGL